MLEEFWGQRLKFSQFIEAIKKLDSEEREFFIVAYGISIITGISFEKFEKLSKSVRISLRMSKKQGFEKLFSTLLKFVGSRRAGEALAYLKAVEHGIGELT